MTDRLVPHLGLAAMALVASTQAHAQQVQAVPLPPLVGDGATPATVQVLAPAGTRVKVQPDRGEIIEALPVDGGHRIVWVPPPVGERTSVGMLVKVRGGGVKEDLRISAEVVPSWTGDFSIVSDPSTIAAGESATLKVRPSSPGPIEGQRRLQIAVSEGTLGDLVPSGDGSWAVRYTAPPEYRLAGPIRPVFVVVDEAAPFSFVDTEVVPVTVQKDVSLEAPPDSMNVLRVADREYGPIKAGSSGAVSFEVDLHPDRTTGTLTSSVAGTPTVTTPTLPVQVPYALVVAPLPDRVGGGTTLGVPFACRTPGGTVCSPGDVSVEVSGGTTDPVQARGELLVVPWTLPDDGYPTITVSAGAEAQAGKATAKVGVVPSPNTLTLSSDPPKLTDEERVARITARAKDPGGKGVIGRVPELQVEGGRLYRQTRDNRDGTYTATWRLDNDADWIEAAAWPRLSGTGLAAQRLVAWPSVDAVNADGATAISLFVVAEDAAGMPVPNTEIELAVPQGDGALPPSVKTDRYGVARIPYKVGVEPGLVQIDVSGAGLTTTTRLWQTGPQAPYPGLLQVGSTPDLEAVQRWKARVAHLYIPKTEAPVVAAAPVTAAPATPTAVPGTATPTPGTAPATPGTAATPPGTAAAPGATPAPGKKPRPGGGGGGGAGGVASSGYKTARLRGALVNHISAYGSSLVGDAADRYAPEAAYTTFSQPGLNLNAELWVGNGKPLGFDARFQASAVRLGLGTEKPFYVPLDVEVGGRYRVKDNGTWSGYAGAGFARITELAFEYTGPERTAATPVGFGIMGAGIGGGIRGEWGARMFELDLQTVWTPIPSLARLEVRGDLPVADPILLHLALGGEGRLSRWRPLDDNDEVRIRTRRAAVTVRAGVSMAF